MSTYDKDNQCVITFTLACQTKGLSDVLIICEKHLAHFSEANGLETYSYSKNSLKAHVMSS